MTSLLVDGNNLLARADFASKRGIEMSHEGVNTAAVVLFANMLSKYVRMVEPTHVGVYWDRGHTERDLVFPAYKAARKEGGVTKTMPFALAEEFLDAAQITHHALGGWEADDLIAAAARAQPGPVVILSGDKDLLQLVDDRVTQIRVPAETRSTPVMVAEKFGAPPEVLPYYLALVGDSVDGIPGVPGIGPKKALVLLTPGALGDAAHSRWVEALARLGREKAAVARTMLQLVDLRYRSWPFEALLPGEFSPTQEPSPRLLDFLRSINAATLASRVTSGTLWSPRPDPVSNIVEWDL